MTEILNPPEHQSIDLSEIENNAPETNDNTSGEITPEKTKLILEINGYKYSRFSAVLSESMKDVFENLDTLSEEQLLNRIQSIKLIISNRNNARFTEYFWGAAANGYENITKLCGLHTN